MPKRIPELDGLRALAILAVLAGHALGVRMMWIGVDLFFVLSGFLITGILLDAPRTGLRAFLARFYRRRARRILPPLILLLLVTSVLYGVGWLRYGWLALGLMNYMQALRHATPFPTLEPLWSLGVEEQFYLLWPIAVFFAGPRRLFWIAASLLLLAPVLRATCTPWVAHQAFNTDHWFIYKATPFRMDTLAAGALIAILWRRDPLSLRRFGHLGLVPALLAAPLMVFLAHRFTGFSTVADTIHGNVLTYEISLAAVAGLLLWALSGRGTGVLCTRPLGYLARISYSLYLIHQTALLYAEHRLAHHPATAIALGLSAALLYASLSWRLLESPILHGGDRQQARRELAAATHPLYAAETPTPLRAVYPDRYATRDQLERHT